MKKLQCIVAHTFRQAERYVAQHKLHNHDYVIVNDANKLRGLAPDKMEFILLDYFWENEFFKEQLPLYNSLLQMGATETRVYSEI